MLRRVNSQIIVEYQGRFGVTEPDLPGMLCTNGNETAVLFDGTTFLEPIKSDELKIIGPLDLGRYY